MLFSASIVSARSFLAQNDRARADSRARSSSREKVEKKIDPLFRVYYDETGQWFRTSDDFVRGEEETGIAL